MVDSHNQPYVDATFSVALHYNTYMATAKELEVERALVERSKTDSQAFGELFDMYYPRILHYTIRRTGDVAIAQDITSEVFIKALQGLAGFAWRGVPFSAWLYKIAANELSLYYRKNKSPLSLDELREVHDFEPIDERDLALELQEAQQRLERQVDFVIAQQCIARLPIRYQEVVTLRFGEQKKLSDIATILGKSEGTVKSLLSRALVKLRKDMHYRKTQPFMKERILSSEGRHTKPQDTYEQ